MHATQAQAVHIRRLGLCEYNETWRKMERFTRERDPDTQDEIWLLQHTPVFTQGVSGKAQHVLDAHAVPVVQSNRGGQVTYHGPGQVVMYVLLDLRRLGMGVRELVSRLENAVIALLARRGVPALTRRDAPGVYVKDRKLAALGLRVSRGCSYHGLALNVDMDITPFGWINPCGFQGLQVTQLKDLHHDFTLTQVERELAEIFALDLGYTALNFQP